MILFVVTLLPAIFKGGAYLSVQLWLTPTGSLGFCQVEQVAFCETDLPLQQLVQETQLAANVMQADLHQRIVAAFEPLVSLPVHAFGFAATAIQNASLPAQTFAKLVGAAGCPVACTFFLRGVTQPATLAAGEVPARRFEHVAPVELELLPADSMLREFYAGEV